MNFRRMPTTVVRAASEFIPKRTRTTVTASFKKLLAPIRVEGAASL